MRRNSFISTILALLFFAIAGYLFSYLLTNYKPPSDMTIVECYRVANERTLQKDTKQTDLDMSVSRTNKTKLAINFTNNTSQRIVLSGTATVRRLELEQTSHSKRVKHVSAEQKVNTLKGFLTYETTQYIDPYDTKEIEFGFEEVGFEQGYYLMEIDGQLLFFELKPNID